MGRCRKLPRLALMGWIPLFIMHVIPVSPVIAGGLWLWGELMLAYFWLEGIYLSLKSIEMIGENGNIFNLIAHLDDMEFDPYEKESESENERSRG